VAELERLVRLSQAGDAEAYTQIVERFQNMALGYAYAFLNDYPQAQDAAQEAFIEAYHSVASLRKPLAFPAWFKRILFKHCDRLVRGKRPALESLDANSGLAAPQLTPPEIAEQHDLARRVQTAILSLPLDQRLATTLFYIDGYSQQEIAEFLEVPVQTIKSRLHTSREKLKERMVDMIEDELKSHQLSGQFTRATVDLAVQQARELNQARQYNQAETLLRQVLSQEPEHPGALKELNRAIMRGQVFAHGRWDLLPELVQHGQLILKMNADEDTRYELARTLLAIPAMPEAVDFLRQWINISGPDVRRLGMLSWASSCVGDYEQAEQLWRETLVLIEQGLLENPQPAYGTGTGRTDLGSQLALIAQSLVDCFSAAGENDRARRVAEQGWALYNRQTGPTSPDHLDWLAALFQAHLPYDEAARVLLNRLGTPNLENRGMALCLRAYFDEPQEILAGWQTWLHECAAAENLDIIERLRLNICRPLRMRGLPDAHIELGEATWQFFDQQQGELPARLKESWNWERFNFFSYFDQKDWDKMEQVAWRGIRSGRMDENAAGVIVACAAQGKTAPAELIEAAALGGVERVDSYGLFGWYLLAREAAAAGKSQEAFSALRRSLGYWSNPPLLLIDVWEQDTHWGALKETAEFRQIFEEKRRRVGKVYGSLYYFPGW